MQSNLDRHAPCRTKKVRNKPTPWVTKEIKKEMYAIKSNSPYDWLCFKQKRNAVNQLVRRAKKCYYQNEIKKNIGNPKGTWKVLNDIMCKKT